ncbi:MAG: hypothetical protein N2663_00390 [Chlorobi bacterium]|nr:hypothetical protein [Chlorobiota bacterium]
MRLGTLASNEGRQMYRRVYQHLRTEMQRGAWETLRILWNIAVRGRSLDGYWTDSVEIEYPLGLWRGTRLWLEEIVSRYYYSTVLSFVYGGAAVLLVVVGLRRFSAGISDTVVLMSIGLEALLLLVLFTVMFFSAADDVDPSLSVAEELVREVGEIGREYALASERLERATDAIERLAEQSSALVHAATDAVRIASEATSPSPAFIQHIASVNSALAELQSSIVALNTAIAAIEKARIEDAVRRELTALLAERQRDSSRSTTTDM